MASIVPRPICRRSSGWVASDASDANGHAVVLRDSRFVETLRQHRGDVLLVRPDRYIAAAVRPEGLSRLEVELQRLMAGTGDGPTSS